jgi:hypothetical protein
MEEIFLEKIKAHKFLGDFILNEEFLHNTSFDNFTENDPAFLEWISPKFYDRYVSLINKALTNNSLWILPKLMRLKLICDDVTAEKCREQSRAVLRNIVSKLKDAKAEIELHNNTKPMYELIPYYESIWIDTFNALPDQDSAIREEFAQESYNVALKFKDDSIKQNVESNIEIFDAVMMVLVDINCSADLKNQINDTSAKFIKKLNKAVNYRVILTVVFIVFIILKFLIRLSR